MGNWSDWMTLWKAKKNSVRNLLATNNYNHPHRVGSIGFSSTLGYYIDEKIFTANASPTNGDIASVYVFALDFTGTTAYQRIFETNQPWISIPSGGPEQGEFVLAHKPHGKFWEFLLTLGTPLDPEVCGTVTRDEYTYNSGTAAWDLTTSGTPSDISIEWYFSLDSGGDPISGGRDVDASDEKMYLETFVSFSGTHSAKLAGILYGIVERFPWDDPWASETTAFTDNFDDFINAANAADGAGHNGSCLVSLDFS